jgi:Tfp pilus assembly protein PilX
MKPCFHSGSATALQPQRQGRRRPLRQRGVVLLFSLIALVVLLIAAVALMRSLNTSLFTAGNIAFKRDLQNQSERAVEQVLADFRAGGALDSPTTRANNVAAQNYSASVLPVNAQGIPTALLADDATFAAAWTAADIDGTTEPTLANQGVSIRYVVDRMCATTGDETALGTATCVLSNNPMPSGGSASNLQGADKAPLCATCASAAPQGVVYRVSVRVTGPRNTQAFFQSTFTIPSST